MMTIFFAGGNVPSVPTPGTVPGGLSSAITQFGGAAAAVLISLIGIAIVGVSVAMERKW